jgi:hypothetical protein
MVIEAAPSVVLWLILGTIDGVVTAFFAFAVVVSDLSCGQRSELLEA